MKIAAFKVRSKKCNGCVKWRNLNPGQFGPPYPHQCWSNHAGSSGSMESDTLMDLIVELWDMGNTSVKQLCCDDDSSVRADCQWSNAVWFRNNPDKTELPLVHITKGPKRGTKQPRPNEGYL